MTGTLGHVLKTCQMLEKGLQQLQLGRAFDFYILKQASHFSVIQRSSSLYCSEVTIIRRSFEHLTQACPSVRSSRGNLRTRCNWAYSISSGREHNPHSGLMKAITHHIAGDTTADLACSNDAPKKKIHPSPRSES